jgi:TolB protein
MGLQCAGNSVNQVTTPHLFDLECHIPSYSYTYGTYKELMKLTFHFFLFFLIFGSMPASAILDIEVTGAGDHQTPITIVPFSGEEKLNQSISNIVSADLARSGLFKVMPTTDKTPHEVNDVDYPSWSGIDILVIGNAVLQSKGRILVKYHLLDTVKKTEIVGLNVSGKHSELRSIAHRISDSIFQKLTGDTGVFNTRIAYINHQADRYQLSVADSDGYEEKGIFSSSSVIMSPSWSPDGSHLAYVAFEHDQAIVYVQSMLTNQRLAVASFPDSDTAPTWSPDGQHLAFVLSRDGSSHIYLLQPDGSNLQQLTFDDQIDTEPNFSPDGESLIFASDRSGKVQIYQMSVDGGDADRLTFEGRNNFSPHYSPDGQSIAYSSWIDGKFCIVTEDINSKQVQVLTNGDWDVNPSFSPNGKMILYATEVNGRGVLATVSIDGKVKQKLASQTGSILDPSWGPLIRP